MIMHRRHQGGRCSRQADDDGDTGKRHPIDFLQVAAFSFLHMAISQSRMTAMGICDLQDEVRGGRLGGRAGPRRAARPGSSPPTDEIAMIDPNGVFKLLAICG